MLSDDPSPEPVFAPGVPSPVFQTSPANACIAAVGKMRAQLGEMRATGRAAQQTGSLAAKILKEIEPDEGTIGGIDWLGTTLDRAPSRTTLRRRRH